MELIIHFTALPEKLTLDMVKSDLAELLEDCYRQGYRHFICGMAQGADMYFGEAVLALREKHPDVTLEAAIPCEEQAARWKERDRNRYFGLVERCDLETMVQHRYTSGCMQRRNRYMVDRSSLVLAVYDGMLGGTMYTLTYAMRQGVRVVTILLFTRSYGLMGVWGTMTAELVFRGIIFLVRLLRGRWVHATALS